MSLQNTVQATLELDERERVQARELELQNALFQAERSPRQSVSTDPFFDVSRNIRLVPTFNERYVEKLFMYFEKVAIKLKLHKYMCSGEESTRGLFCS